MESILTALATGNIATRNVFYKLVFTGSFMTPFL